MSFAESVAETVSSLSALLSSSAGDMRASEKLYRKGACFEKKASCERL